MEARPTGPHGTLIWSGQLGRPRAELRRVGDRTVLTIGKRQITVRDDAVVRHRAGLLYQRLIIEHPGEPTFTHRYRLHWALQLAPLWETTYDRWSAEADDDGLGLVEVLGGTDDWVDPTDG
ncbi:hypothetical protein [Streptomyces sp. NPDC000410]|uniref:hypothetical protein n=1 Tax=Streptomyces sp. NPDC000410 TaxID=3154254 RepID=UPI00332D4592